MRQFAICALAFGLAAAPFAAQAAGADDGVVRERASYSDLNLNRNRDAGVMLNRLHVATLEACGASEFSFRDYRASVVKSACYQDGLRQAVQKLNAPKVTGLYEDRPELALASR